MCSKIFDHNPATQEQHLSTNIQPAIRLSRVLVQCGRIRDAATKIAEDAFEPAAALESLGYGAVTDEVDRSVHQLLRIADEIEASARATTSPTQASLVIA